MKSLSYALFLGTLFFAPLAFGSVETWSIATVEVLVFLTTIIYFFTIRRNSSPFHKVPGIIPLFLLLLFMWGQLLPLPPSLVAIIAPGIHKAYAPIIAVSEGSQWIPLTVNQKSTLLEALRISSYVLFYILTIQLLSRQELLRKTVKIVVWLAAAIAFLAILQKFTSPDLIYWFRAAPENASPVGPWIYRNHYAGFMELLFPIVLALFFYYRPRIDRKTSWRQKVVSTLSSHGSSEYFFLGFSAILIISSIFIGLSRGGIISATLALLFFLVLLSKKSSHRGRIAPLILFSSLLLVITWFGWDPIMERFNATTDASGAIKEGRLLVWKDCLPYIKDFFLTGSGFGTFIHTFPQYSNQPPATIYDHAHNDYLELFTDGGLIGFILVAGFVCIVLKNGFVQLKIRREPYSVFLIIGALSAIFSIMIHSITDFNMHNGANGLYFFFLCGLLISAGNTRIHFRNRRTLLPEDRAGWKFSCLTALPLLILTIVVQSGIISARQHFQEASKIYINPLLSKSLLTEQLAQIDTTIGQDPLEGLYSSYKGNILSFLKDHSAALDNYIDAARKDPLEGAYLQRVGLHLPKDKEALTAILMTEGYKRGLNKEQHVLVLAEWYMNREERQKAVFVLQQGSRQFSDIAKRLPPFLLNYHFTRDEITQILPEKPGPWIALGVFYERAAQVEESEYYRRRALEFIANDDKILPSYFTQLYQFYRKQKRINDAVAVLHQGIEWLPDYAPFHIYLGDYYNKQKITYRAREEYEQALMLEPGNDRIRKRLERLEINK